MKTKKSQFNYLNHKKILIFLNNTLIFIPLLAFFFSTKIKIMKHHSPYHLPSILLPILLLSCNTLSTTLSQGSPTTAASTSGDLLIGSLRSCAHNVSGDVYVLNSNQIKIKNFTYDGLGNKAWFHIMTPKALTIHAALPDTFVPVYNDNGDCAAINRSYSNEDLTIILPTGHPKTKNLTINQIKSFGVFSYGDCSNYGNVYFVHKWRALFASNKSLIPGVALKTEPCWPPVIPDLSNPQFCNPGAVK